MPNICFSDLAPAKQFTLDLDLACGEGSFPQKPMLTGTQREATLVKTIGCLSEYNRTSKQENAKGKRLLKVHFKSQHRTLEPPGQKRPWLGCFGQGH